MKNNFWHVLHKKKVGWHSSVRGNLAVDQKRVMEFGRMDG